MSAKEWNVSPGDEERFGGLCGLAVVLMWGLLGGALVCGCVREAVRWAVDESISEFLGKCVAVGEVCCVSSGSA